MNNNNTQTITAPLTTATGARTFQSAASPDYPSVRGNITARRASDAAVHWKVRAPGVLSFITALGLLALASSTLAVPYACDITNSGGIVSFRLNENADNVKVIRGTVTNDLGAG